MNGFMKVLAWAVIIVLGWFGLKLVAGTFFGLVGLLANIIALLVSAAVLLGVVSLIRVLYRKTQEK